MQYVKNIFDFFISASIWVAISVTGLTYITYKNFDIYRDDNILLLVLSATIFGYNFVKFFEKKQLSDFDFKIIKKRFFNLKLKQRITLLLSLVFLLLSIICFLQLQLKTQLFLALPALLTFFYTNSFKKQSLRLIKGIKIYIIGLCWVFVTVSLPIMEVNMLLSADVLLEMTQRFLFVVAITLPFEIRDLQIDPEKLHTIPQKIGIQKTKFLGIVLLFIFFFLDFFKDEIPEYNMYTMPFVFLASLLAITLAKEKQSQYYASFWTEGIPVLWAVLVLIF